VKIDQVKKVKTGQVKKTTSQNRPKHFTKNIFQKHVAKTKFADSLPAFIDLFLSTWLVHLRFVLFLRS
jgi:hypothetical protein